LVANNNNYKVKGWNGQDLGVVKLLKTIVEMMCQKNVTFCFRVKVWQNEIVFDKHKKANSKSL
jgi:hypothetical protein